VVKFLGEPRVLVVAPWGNPATWFQVMYSFSNITCSPLKDLINPGAVYSRSSTIALTLKLLESDILSCDDVKTLVLGSDSVLVSTRQDKFEDVLKSGENIKKLAEEDYQNFIKKFLQELASGQGINRDLVEKVIKKCGGLDQVEKVFVVRSVPAIGIYSAAADLLSALGAVHRFPVSIRGYICYLRGSRGGQRSLHLEYDSPRYHH